jgi:transposase
LQVGCCALLRDWTRLRGRLETRTLALTECLELGTVGRKRIARLAGLAPMARQSGRWQGLAFIQGGRRPLRDAPYMPAVAAIRFDLDM